MFHRWVLKRDREEWNFKPARPSRKVPDFLTLPELHLLFGQMSGVPQLQAQIMAGTGLRVSECLSLRIKDLDFRSGGITVRNGKGGKDRTVGMPKCLVSQLQEQIEKAEHFWKVDRKTSNPAPYLPESLEKKLGKQTTEFPWFWLFPASKLSKDPRSGIIRRHHLTDRGVAKAIKIAAAKAGIQKRVTPHVMRHSFATESLRNGLDIKSLATLLGHKSTATTEIYLHALPDLAFRAVSPLDAQPQSLIAFPGAESQQFRSAM
jgi:site-specific recombinase XerD